MSFTALEFFIFLLIGVVVYYLIPKLFRWIWLLILSYAYYASFSTKTIGLIVFTTIVTYIGGRVLDYLHETEKSYIATHKQEITKEEKKAYKARVKHTKRLVVVCMLILNFGVLALVKYSDFIVSNINAVGSLFGFSGFTVPTVLLPLGISFYTFQSVSYIIDMYQGKYRAQRNPFRFALFVSFFPQLLQGPIGRYDRLSTQLYEGNAYNLTNIQFGLQRILWGLFKKMLLADRASVFVTQVFNNYALYGGWYNIIALLLYSIELYADFSGGIDIVIGAAQMFGIKMDENFRQPYFSKSIGEFWRRWHITLGTWMKDYIFYPFSLSKGLNRFGKWSKKHFGNQMGKTLPICLANLLIFFVVGIWHGAAWKYIAYGMYNGVIIAASNLLEPVYHKGLAFFHIKSESRVWKLFQMIRTFILINIGWYFDMGIGLGAALEMMKMTVTNFHMSQLTDGSMIALGIGVKDFRLLALGVVIVLIVSICKERGMHIRESIAKMPLPIRWGVFYALIVIILLFGYTGTTKGFIYANF